MLKLDLGAPNKLQLAFDSLMDALFQGIPIGEPQRGEMKKAFFGGAHTVLAICSRIGDNDVSEERGVEIIQSLQLEVQHFALGLPDNGPGGLTDEEVVTSPIPRKLQ